MPAVRTTLRITNRIVHVSFSAIVGRRPDGFGKESTMAWKTPKIVEVPVGMEINMYACAARK